MCWFIHKRKLTSIKTHALPLFIGRYGKGRCYMPRPTDQADHLLGLANRDMTSFFASTSHPEVDISATGFFAQQVVEKRLKAVAPYYGIVFRRTHDVDELVDLLLQDQVAMPFPPDQFSVLNPFAVILRYQETSFISMSLATMIDLVELAYQWAYRETRGGQTVDQGVCL